MEMASSSLFGSKAVSSMINLRDDGSNNSDDSDKLNHEEEEEEESDMESQDQKDHQNKFGPIPRLRSSCVLGTCCNQERMCTPCRHVTLVCQDNESILGVNRNGFPLLSVHVFWCNQDYL